MINIVIIYYTIFGKFRNCLDIEEALSGLVCCILIEKRAKLNHKTPFSFLATVKRLVFLKVD